MDLMAIGGQIAEAIVKLLQDEEAMSVAHH